LIVREINLNAIPLQFILISVICNDFLLKETSKSGLTWTTLMPF
jgi:hypothetical protein